MTPDALKKLIQDHLPNATVRIESDDEIHFTAEVICATFMGKSRVQQQQMVYHIVNPYIKNGELHALSLKTRAE